MTALVLLGLHPWYVRYSVEARGYALLFTLVPVALGCLVRALETGSLAFHASAHDRQGFGGSPWE